MRPILSNSDCNCPSFKVTHKDNSWLALQHIQTIQTKVFQDFLMIFLYLFSAQRIEKGWPNGPKQASHLLEIDLAEVSSIDANPQNTIKATNVFKSSIEECFGPIQASRTLVKFSFLKRSAQR